MIRTFADYVISKQLELKNLKPEDVYSDRDILVQFFTLLMAGAATTGFTLAWAFYLLGTLTFYNYFFFLQWLTSLKRYIFKNDIFQK